VPAAAAVETHFFDMDPVEADRFLKALEDSKLDAFRNSMLEYEARERTRQDMDAQLAKSASLEEYVNLDAAQSMRGKQAKRVVRKTQYRLKRLVSEKNKRG
jgi:hypothetical protein